MVPLQSSLTVTLPADTGSSGNHNAFPGFQPTIERFDDKVCASAVHTLLQFLVTCVVVSLCEYGK